MQGQHTYPWEGCRRMLSVCRFSSSSKVLGKEEGLTITTYNIESKSDKLPQTSCDRDLNCCVQSSWSDRRDALTWVKL
jgi:hypothetical protein